MSTKFDIDVNQFPSLTWNFLKINRTHLETELKNDSGFTSIAASERILLTEVDFESLSSDFKAVETGLGKTFDAEFDSFAKNGKTVYINVPADFSCNGLCRTKIELELLDGESKAKDFVIHAEENSECEFIFTFRGAKLNEGCLGARIRVIAEENARVKISYVNLLGEKALCFVSTGSIVKDNGRVEVIELQLGGNKVYSGNRQELSGYKAAFEGHTAYLAKKNAEFDFNYVSNQTGRETESLMVCDGICGDKSKKTWRGTINFVKGCVESKGDEQENALLLSPEVVNKTLPVILCDEEAVEGRHGATIGKLGKDILFYMQSRGVDEKEAQRLMIQAKINSVCRLIGDSDIEKLVQDVIEG